MSQTPDIFHQKEKEWGLSQVPGVGYEVKGLGVR